MNPKFNEALNPLKRLPKECKRNLLKCSKRRT